MKVTSVRYEEIPKPLPKKREQTVYVVNVTQSQKFLLEQFMKDNYIHWS